MVSPHTARRGPFLVTTIVALLLLSAVASALTGCASAEASGVVVVEMRDLRFIPSTVTIKRGDTVRWVNRDQTAHTSTSNDWSLQKFQNDEDQPGEWNTFPLSPGDSFEVTFEDGFSAGDYDYFCMVHPYMVGTVTIEE